MKRDHLKQGFLVILMTLVALLVSQASNLSASDHLLRADGSSIRYYLQPAASAVTSELLMPEAKSRSLLLLIQGSGCVSVSQQSDTMRQMADVLPMSDVVWVEKRGLEEVRSTQWIQDGNCPQDYYQYESLFQRVADYRAVITALAPNYDQVTILGGSEGATIVGLLLQEDLPIHAGIALNGGGQYFIEDILWNIEKTVPEPDRAMALEGMRNFSAQVLAMTEAELLEDLDFSSNHHARWWQEMLSLDMSRVWSRGKTPLLMVQTLGDDNVSVVSAKALFQNLEPYSHIQTLQLPELDHGFKDVKGNSQVKIVILEIQDWLRKIE